MMMTMVTNQDQVITIQIITIKKARVKKNISIRLTNVNMNIQVKKMVKFQNPIVKVRTTMNMNIQVKKMVINLIMEFVLIVIQFQNPMHPILVKLHQRVIQELVPLSLVNCLIINLQQKLNRI